MEQQAQNQPVNLRIKDFNFTAEKESRTDLEKKFAIGKNFYFQFCDECNKCIAVEIKKNPKKGNYYFSAIITHEDVNYVGQAPTHTGLYNIESGVVSFTKIK